MGCHKTLDKRNEDEDNRKNARVIQEDTQGQVSMFDIELFMTQVGICYGDRSED